MPSENETALEPLASPRSDRAADAWRAWRVLTDRLGIAMSYLSAVLITAVCVGIIGYLLYNGYHSLSWSFLMHDPDATLLGDASASGVRAPIVGTLVLIILSTLVVFPISLATAIYLAEYMDERKPITRFVRLGLEVLAGVPSVVFGMFGLAMFSAPWLAFLSSKADGVEITAAFGRSFIVASIVMAVHIMPFVIKVMEESIRAVPREYREGAHALGLTKWRTIRKVVLPAATPGLVTATILGMGLIAGDTAIVWLTLGGTIVMTGADQWWLPVNWVAALRGTGSTLTTFVYYSSPAGDGNAPEKAYGAAFLLMTIVLALNACVALFGRSRGARTRAR